MKMIERDCVICGPLLGRFVKIGNLYGPVFESLARDKYASNMRTNQLVSRVTSEPVTST